MISITWFQSEDEQEYQIVRCTGNHAWRKNKDPRNDTVLLWNGKSSDRHFQATSGRIPTRLRCLFTIRDPQEIQSNWCLALVSTFTIGSLRQPEGMVIVEESNAASGRSSNSTGRSRRAPQTGVGSTYIVPVKAIQAAAHLIPLDPSQDNRRWYLSNTVDLNMFNLLYI